MVQLQLLLNTVIQNMLLLLPYTQSILNYKKYVNPNKYYWVTYFILIPINPHALLNVRGGLEGCQRFLIWRVTSNCSALFLFNFKISTSKHSFLITLTEFSPYIFSSNIREWSIVCFIKFTHSHLHLICLWFFPYFCQIVSTATIQQMINTLSCISPVLTPNHLQFNIQWGLCTTTS